MLLHVVFRQFDADGETLYNEDDPREFESDLVGISPCPRVDQVRSMWAEDDSADGGDCRFTNVQSFLDEGRAQHEKGGEAAENDVDQVRAVDREVIPRHRECGLCCSSGSGGRPDYGGKAKCSQISLIADVQEGLQPDCVSFPIPQSVESLKRTAWCRRSIQNKVPPRRQSNLLEKCWFSFCTTPRCVRVMIVVPQKGLNMDILRISEWFRGLGEADKLDGGELEVGEGMFDFRVFQEGPDG